MITEMFDGAVFVSPSPGFGHVDAVLALAGRLRAARRLGCGCWRHRSRCGSAGRPSCAPT